MLELLASLVIAALSVAIVVWLNRPDPNLLKNTPERRWQHIRHERSKRWED